MKQFQLGPMIRFKAFCGNCWKVTWHTIQNNIDGGFCGCGQWHDYVDIATPEYA